MLFEGEEQENQDLWDYEYYRDRWSEFSGISQASRAPIYRITTLLVSARSFARENEKGILCYKEKGGNSKFQYCFG